MQRLGLALSGGGFRATLYHLGIVRLLRDAGILPKITHITTVSGGSVLGAHLALHWDRYCGSTEAFDEVAQELIQFVKLDVRNRIVRRFPFGSAVNRARSVLRLPPARQLTRPGLLEQHYERFLYGDVPLSQLPDRPRLHILATNLSEGCLCSFNRNGLLLQRRVPGRRDRFERVRMGLATVPMAVAASSAFPGFFPPLELNGWEVGADEGEFNLQAFTDGGVYDNLGLRMFRCLEQTWLREASPLRKDDILELEDVRSSLLAAINLPEETPLRRLRELLDAHDDERVLSQESADTSDLDRAIVHGLWEVIRSEELHRDAVFQNMKLGDSTARSLLNYVAESGQATDLEHRAWLNRQIVDSALRQVIGKPCLRMSRREFDGILVSDAGGKFKVNRDVRKAGLISTALRASDILMDRVWQLELEAFENSPGVLFFPISNVVNRSHDPFALHPEVQRQAAKIRTDLDRFSDLEISTLVQHGYCVARDGCRSVAELREGDIPNGAPWNPISDDNSESQSAPSKRNAANDHVAGLQTARQLRWSSRRKVWRTLLSWRDWPTFVWAALVICLATGLPYYVYQVHKRSQRQQMVLQAVADMSSDYRKILSLLNNNPEAPVDPLPYVEVETLEPSDFSGFEVLSDTRIFDLRAWKQAANAPSATVYARITVRRLEGGTQNSHLRLKRISDASNVPIHCEPARVKPTLSRMRNPDGSYTWEVDLDFSQIPIDARTDVNLQRAITPDIAASVADEGRFNFSVLGKTGLLEVWMLLPPGRAYKSFEVSGYPRGKRELAKTVVPHSSVQLAFGSVATFRLINPEVGHSYECRWTWDEE